jgi:MFS family permease
MEPRWVGAVTALPLAAQVLQVLGAFLTTRFGHRRTALVAVALSRQAFLPLALLPFTPLGPEGRRAALLAAAAAHHGLGIVANNAWTAWMGDMVPSALRGRYFGRRTAFCTVIGGSAALAAGLALDRAHDPATAAAVLQAMSLLASVAGVVTVILMARQHDGRPATARRPAWRSARPRATPSVLRALARPLRDRRARGVVLYTAVWNGACGLSAPFFALYLLRDLGTGYAILAAEGAGLAAAKIASAGAWGRVVDRFGPRRVLTWCTAGLALSPVAWLACAPGRLWPLVLETAAGGVLLGGHGVATFALPLSVAPRRERAYYLAAIAVAGGAAFAVTSAAGCALADGSRAVHAPLRLLLAASTVLRLAAFAAALNLPARLAPRLAAEPGPADVAVRRKTERPRWRPHLLWARSAPLVLPRSAARARRGGGSRSSVHDRLG